MKAIRALAAVLTLVLVLVLASAVAFAADPAPGANNNNAATATASLDTAIPYALKLLEARDYKTFLKTFVHPDLYAKFLGEAGGVDSFAERFGQDKAGKLLEVLTKVKDLKPSLEDDGNTAIYKLDQAISGKDSITFVKVNNAWYIKN